MDTRYRDFVCACRADPCVSFVLLSKSFWESDGAQVFSDFPASFTDPVIRPYPESV